MKKLITFLLLIQACLANVSAQDIKGIIVADTANLTILKVWGTHEERGFAYGYLIGDQISNMVTGYMLPVFGENMNAARQIIIDGEDLVIGQEYVDEAIAVIEGMNAAGTNYADIDYIDGLVFNSFLDIVKLLGMTVDGPGCSSLMSWGDATAGTDLDGKSVISRHLDWTPNPTIINNQVIVVHFPSETDEQPFVIIGFAGQMSVLSGFNSTTAVFQHMMSDFTASSVQGVGFEPVWLTLRKAIEKLDYNNDGFNNTRDVRDAIGSNPMGYADGYIITALAPSSAGADSLVALVAEVTPQPPLITFRGNEYSDLIPGDNLYAANYEIKRNNHNHYCTRYYAVVNAIGAGTGIGSEENWQIMRDYSNASYGNIQFMQFIPETDVFRISVHREGSPAYLKPPVEFAISELLDLPVGTNNNQNLSESIFFPNPVQNNLYLQLEINEQSQIFRIFSITGNLLQEGTIQNKTQSISVKHLQSGVYFLTTNDNYWFKFIKF
jgi:hypothetical protein